MLAALDCIVSSLQRHQTFYHGNAPEASRPKNGNLPYERKIPFAVRAVSVRQRTRIHENVSRNHRQLSVRILLCGARIPFYDQHGVLFDLLGHARRRLVVAASAHGHSSVKGKYFQLLSLNVRAPNLLDLRRRISLCVNNALALVQIGAHAAVGINLERRHHADRYVSARVYLVVAFDFDALFLVPHDFVKHRSARFAPHSALVDNSVYGQLFGAAFKTFFCQLCGIYVLVLVGKGSYRHFGTHPRQLGKPRFVYGRNMIEHLFFLPFKGLFVLDKAVARNGAVLISRKKIHIELPAQFIRSARLLSFLKILLYLLHQLLGKTLRNAFLPFLSDFFVTFLFHSTLLFSVLFFARCAFEREQQPRPFAQELFVAQIRQIVLLLPSVEFQQGFGGGKVGRNVFCGYAPFDKLHFLSHACVFVYVLLDLVAHSLFEQHFFDGGFEILLLHLFALSLLISFSLSRAITDFSSGGFLGSGREQR